MKLEDRWMVARRGERLAERKNEGEKKKEAAAGEKGTPIYDGERGQGAGLRRIYTADTYTTGTSMYVRTHVRVHVHIHSRGCGGSRVCTRIRARVVREEFLLPAHAGISSYVAQHWPPSLEQAGWN